MTFAAGKVELARTMNVLQFRIKLWAFHKVISVETFEGGIWAPYQHDQKKIAKCL